ncbi:hypothetical protein E2562_011917 [Oryza meyeriana var. granulata]|uniref:Uncharacterized protein n=1 Tax=Oryza meyeriana var. granulata TaxID=110450 RepID=A0A6G1CGG2_9ORYZ|nr:hypothetical protein E2562_011917 [Oryza meyeriana var. granulata]
MVMSRQHIQHPPPRIPLLLPPPPPTRPPRIPSATTSSHRRRLLAIVVLSGGIWLSHRAATTDCERLLERPVISLEVLLFVLSHASLAGALFENWGKIRSYL